jgi:DNA-binding CsgD family transcriptional regulator
VVAWAAAEIGEARMAATLIGAVARMREYAGISLIGPLAEAAERAEHVARTALGTRAYSAAVARGARMDTKDAVRLALGETSPVRTGWRGLTDRETQVAGLVAEGLSNRDIAARLVISERTAEGHVENILRKLGESSRTRVARLWAEDFVDNPAENQRELSGVEQPGAAVGAAFDGVRDPRGEGRVGRGRAEHGLDVTQRG